MSQFTLDDAITDTLDRLGDPRNKIWSRDEIGLYLEDGYNLFTRRTKCLFDIVVIENLPPVGNWQTDLEYYQALQIPGFGVTDSPFHFTSDSDRDHGVDGSYGGPYSGPAGLTSPSDQQYASSIDSVPTAASGGRLPVTTVDIIRVTFDERQLYALGSAQARQLDPNYEKRDGDPRFYTWDKDGIYNLRVIPRAQGDATYDIVDGSWGTLTQTDDSTVEIVTTEVTGFNTGGFGILRHRDDLFPTFGPWGSPTRIHPVSKNIKVGIYRLGRDLHAHPFELPLTYLRYPIYWAMARSLHRDGPGQDIELADHFEQRFELGVSRMTSKKNKMDREYTGRFTGAPTAQPFGLGLPQAPFPYGRPF